MGVAVQRAPVVTQSPEPLKSSVTGPSLLVNCYLEIKFQGEPPLILVNDTWAKWGFDELLEYFGGYNGQFSSDLLQTWFVYQS